ncbi:MAG: hypothetical protein RIR69_1537 [Actinomycetota bacterium]|jgi:hypothetical protein
MAASLDQLIQRADLDALVRYVDDTCSARDWEHVVDIRNESRSAVNTGRQLWPIATLANYRLALWAPAPLAARALDDTARTFMPGPVPEILAVHHNWLDLEPYLPPGHDRSLFAYERALRGDVIASDEPELLDIPIAVQSWEPEYACATYNDAGVVDTPPRVSQSSETHIVIGKDCTPIADQDTVDAFRTMMNAWTSQSNGTARAVVVEGDVEEALGALGFAGSTSQVRRLSPHDAWSQMTWAASSGGAHGKRRGFATARSDTWWLFGNFAGICEPWPPASDECGEIAGSCEYFDFTNDKTPTDGWGLRLVVVDPDEGRSLALIAHDTL